MNRILTVFPIVLALVLAPLATFAQGQQQSNLVAEASKVQAEIVRRVNHDESRVKIKLRNGSQVKGRITATSDNMFTIKDEKTGASSDLAYSDVAKVEGRGLSKGAKIGIIAAIAGAGVVIAGIISFRNFDPFENGILR